MRTWRPCRSWLPSAQRLSTSQHVYLLKLLICLPAEAHYDVSAQAHFGNHPPDFPGQLQVGLPGVVPPHSVQDLSAATLHGQMNVLANVVVLLDHFQQLQGEILGMGRSEPEANIRVSLSHCVEQVCKPVPRLSPELIHFCKALRVAVLGFELLRLIVVAVDILAQQGDVLHSLLLQTLNLLEDVGNWAWSLPAAHEGHDAVGAHVVAAPHDGEVCQRGVLVLASWSDIRIGLLHSELHVHRMLTLFSHHSLNQLRQAAIAIWPAYDLHSLFKHLLLQPLRHAAQQPHYFLLFELAHSGVDPLLSSLANGTGVHQHDLCIFKACLHILMLFQHTPHYFRIILVHLAAISFDMKGAFPLQGLCRILRRRLISYKLFECGYFFDFHRVFGGGCHWGQISQFGEHVASECYN